MRSLCLDFETYYDQQFTLSKMTTSAYVRGLNYNLVHGCAFYWMDMEASQPYWVDRVNLPAYFASLDWSDIIALAHHSHFDMAILNWVYGHRPMFILDTLSMARAYFPGESVSLAKLSERLGIPAKGTEVENTRGILPVNMTQYQNERLARYAARDVVNTVSIWNTLKHHFPMSELQLIDMTVRQFTEPVLVLNQDLLKQAYADEVKRKNEMIAYAQSHKELLGSNPQFAMMLEMLGVEPPMKLSPAALKRGEEVWTYAFSKSDEEFTALKEHGDPRVVALVEARLAVKSTITETRTSRMLALGSPAPFYYKYYGAAPGRWSGGDKLNPQNLTRGSALREAIEAPTGYNLVVRDLSQIEARILAVFAGQWNVVQQFANREDVYSKMASVIFGRHVDRKKNKDDFIPGFIGKAVVLGCIAEGELVLTDQGLVKIENVTLDMKVWDGVEFVSHTGVVYQGDKEVMIYDGLTATPDHIVFTETGETCEFWQAAHLRKRIATTGYDRHPVWFVGDYQYRNTTERETYISSLPLPVWNGAMGERREPSTGGNIQVPSVHGKREQSITKFEHAREAIRSNRIEMQQPEQPQLQGLRGKRDTVSIPESERVHSVGRAELTAQGLQGDRDRQDQQRLPLYAGEPTVSDPRRTNDKSKEYQLDQLQGAANTRYTRLSCTAIPSPRSNVLTANSEQSHSQPEANTGTGSGAILYPCERQTKRTYDITNAGPRHRFTVSGKLVHNCGYGLGWLKFQSMIRVGMLGMKGILFDEAMLEALGADVSVTGKRGVYEKIQESKPFNLSLEQHVIHCICAIHIINTFRNNNAEIVNLWDTAQKALEYMVAGERFDFGVGVKLYTEKDAIVFPNQMRLKYPKLAAHRKGKNGVEYTISQRKGRTFETKKVYGGLIVENCLMGDTLVLTQVGWMPIRRITPAHLIFDGVNFVQHAGVICKGRKAVLPNFGGIGITASHKVETLVEYEGGCWYELEWKKAKETTARRAAVCCRKKYGAVIKEALLYTNTYGPIREINAIWHYNRGPQLVYDILDCGRNHRFVVLSEYGPIMVHNCTQGLARIVMAHDMLKMREEGIKVVMHTHDEVVAMALETEAEETYNRMGEIMGTPPNWAPTLPLDSEGGWAQNYSK